ncbi:MAG: ribokinase [Chitinophagaceae bacterium]
MPAIIVIGSCNTDMVIKTNHFPSPGETIMGGEFFMFSGGKGANQAVAAARMGAAVTLVCKTGDDIFGLRAKQEFIKENIDTSYVKTDVSLASGTALILVDKKGENEIVVAPGANNSLDVDDVKAIEKQISANDIVLLQLEIPIETVLYAAKKAHANGAKVILNPAPAQTLPAEIFPLIYLLTPNETEAALLTGTNVTDENSAVKAATELLQKGVQNVIITLGSKGALFKNKSTQLLIETPKVTAVDTTAAGDVFNGVLSVALSEGKDWEEAIAFACKAAAMSVTRMGAQASMPYRKELEAF